MHPPWARGCGGSEGRRRPSRQRRPGLPPLGQRSCVTRATPLCVRPTEVLRRAELCWPGIWRPSSTFGVQAEDWRGGPTVSQSVCVCGSTRLQRQQVYLSLSLDSLRRRPRGKGSPLRGRWHGEETRGGSGEVTERTRCWAGTTVANRGRNQGSRRRTHAQEPSWGVYAPFLSATE